MPRPLSSTSPRPSSSASCDRPPFVLYGSGDTELQTGSKRTHNVHCSTDVSLMSNIASLFFFVLDFLDFKIICVHMQILRDTLSVICLLRVICVCNYCKLDFQILIVFYFQSFLYLYKKFL